MKAGANFNLNPGFKFELKNPMTDPTIASIGTGSAGGAGGAGGSSAASTGAANASVAGGIAAAVGSAVMAGVGAWAQQRLDEVKMRMAQNQNTHIEEMAKIETEAQFQQIRTVEAHQSTMVGLVKDYRKSEVDLKKAQDQLKITEAKLKTDDAVAKTVRNSYSMGKPVQIYS